MALIIEINCIELEVKPIDAIGARVLGFKGNVYGDFRLDHYQPKSLNAGHKLR